MRSLIDSSELEKHEILLIHTSSEGRGSAVSHPRETHVTSFGLVLSEAMCYMEDAERNASLWTDAICINQPDVT